MLRGCGSPGPAGIPLHRAGFQGPQEGSVTAIRFEGSATVLLSAHPGMSARYVDYCHLPVSLLRFPLLEPQPFPSPFARCFAGRPVGRRRVDRRRSCHCDSSGILNCRAETALTGSATDRGRLRRLLLAPGLGVVPGDLTKIIAR